MGDGDALTLELGPEQSGAPCECCGLRSTTVHGIVYGAGAAFAVYHAGWTSNHPQLGVNLAVAVGDDTVAFAMEAFPTESEIRFALVEPEQSPFAGAPRFTNLLTRERALR